MPDNAEPKAAWCKAAVRVACALLFVSYVFFAAHYFLPGHPDAGTQDPASMTASPPSAPSFYLDRYQLGETPSNHVQNDTITINQTTVCFALTDAFKTGTKAGTYSMIPTINNLSQVVYERPTKENVLVGDIIIFRSSPRSNKTILHRVTNITENGTYLTRGDNNKYPDRRPVEFHQILGVVAAIVY